ncbi:MAG: radical SAM protein [Desulfobacterales bacterium]|nr:MAG: radical SAM protein [Desulfobacterales bacterium]
MKKKVYFADFTYCDTGLRANDLFPLGCGYVAAYTKSLFGSECDIDILRFTDEFFKVMEKSPPDIFAGSCYVWNKNLVLYVSKLIKKMYPNCMVVLGGLAFPLDSKRQKEFLLKNRQVDFFIPYDGEIGFANLMKEYFNTHGEYEKMKNRSIAGSICLNKNDDFILGEKTQRPKNMDKFPSPYLSGMLDKFFEDGRFSPLIQTSRGCPHTCAYCWASNKENRKIGFFSLERVNKELDYITNLAVQNNIYDLVLADSNFGLYKKDWEIVEKIHKLQEEYNYPRLFSAPYGKGEDLGSVELISKMKGVTYAIAVQSTDSKILKNIKRRPADLDTASQYIKSVHKMGKYVHTEIITGLPYETKEIHMKTIRDLIDCGFDFVDAFTFMLLDGIALNTDEMRKEFKYDIRYRLIPREFGKVKDNYVFETEEVVVGTNTYTLEDYIYLRGFHGLLRITFNNDTYRELLNYIKQSHIHIMDWLTFVYDDLRNNSSRAYECFRLFLEEARSELWDSPEELEAYYSKEENYQKLLTRERGDNLMQKYSILASSIYFDIYTDYFIEMTKRYLESQFKDKKRQIARELEDLEKFIYAKLSGVFNRDIQKKVNFSVNFDIIKWRKDGFTMPLAHYEFESPRVLQMALSDDQKALLENNFKRYNYDFNEKHLYVLYRSIVLLNIDNYFRKEICYLNEEKEVIEERIGLQG